MSDDNNFRGIILVRKDSGIKKLTDLKGKAESFPTPTALAAGRSELALSGHHRPDNAPNDRFTTGTKITDNQTRSSYHSLHRL